MPGAAIPAMRPAQLRGGPAATVADFFDEDAARAQEEQKLDYVLDRWGSSPSLLAVDLLEEPESPQGGPYGRRRSESERRRPARGPRFFYLRCASETDE